MALPRPRGFSTWFLQPPFLPGKPPVRWAEAPNASLLLETLGRHAALKAVGTARMTGAQGHKNNLWISYRNFIRQAMSNFDAAMGVPNRSSSLLYYYAMLNFAKAELIDQHHSEIIDKRIGHGLSFSPVNAKSVAGDYLTVTSGVFPLLYEARTGYRLQLGTKLPLKRLLTVIPEIGSQLNDSGIAKAGYTAVDSLIAIESQSGWMLLRVDADFFEQSSLTQSHLLKYFTKVEAPSVDWRDIFAISRRYDRHSVFLQSKKFVTGNPVDLDDVRSIMTDISDLYAVSSHGGDHDAFLTPYLYKTKKLVMPPSLARYAVTYYASSLVRYRPTAFDADRSPEQAYLFDAVARECAVPMLVDTLSGLEGRPQIFRPEGSLRC